MSSDEREAIMTSIANLWTLNAVFISNLLRALRDTGFPAERLEELLQGIDSSTEALEGETERAYAVGLVATVRSMCRCLRIQSSGFSVWQKTPLSQDARQTELVRQA